MSCRSVSPPKNHKHVLINTTNASRSCACGQVREALELSFSDFDVVEFVGDGLTLSQLQMFATASVIVAPHGAGLANTVVSPLHTPVLEIAPIL